MKYVLLLRRAHRHRPAGHPFERVRGWTTEALRIRIGSENSLAKPFELIHSLGL